MVLKSLFRFFWVVGVWLGGMTALSLPSAAFAQQLGWVYTCTNNQGKHLRSDRPIPECADREQRLLDQYGIERRRIGPVLTDRQHQERVQNQRQERIEQQRQRDQQRREEFLAQRFPNAEAHQQERQRQLKQFDDLATLSRIRLEQLQSNLAQVQEDLQVYRDHNQPAPSQLRSSLAEAEVALRVHERSMRVEAQNRQQTIDRLDDELRHLKRLWGQ